METIRKTWSKASVTKEAKKYDTKWDFYNKQGGAYQYAKSLGEEFFESITSHMPSSNMGKRDVPFKTFEQAQQWAQKNQITTIDEWHTASRDGRIPKDIPINPALKYEYSGWIDWPDFLGKQKNRKITPDICQKLAAKHLTQTNFRLIEPVAYDYCVKFDLLEKIFRGLKLTKYNEYSLQTCKGTIELIEKIAAQYRSLQEWKYSINSEHRRYYHIALNCYLLEFIEFKSKWHTQYSKSICLEQAKKYDNPVDWKTDYPNYVFYAKSTHIYSDCIEHMKNHSDSWSLKDCISDFKKYQCFLEWATYSHTAYTESLKNNWIEPIISATRTWFEDYQWWTEYTEKLRQPQFSEIALIHQKMFQYEKIDQLESPKAYQLRPTNLKDEEWEKCFSSPYVTKPHAGNTVKEKYYNDNPHQIFSWGHLISHFSDRPTLKQILSSTKLFKNYFEWANFDVMDGRGEEHDHIDEYYTAKYFGWLPNIKHQFTINESDQRKTPFLSFQKAKKWARNQNKINTQQEWQLASRRGLLPDNIPSNPYQQYIDKGWDGWADFLGRDETFYFEQCRAAAEMYNSRTEWRDKSPSTYERARKNDWLNILCSEMKPKRNKWDFDACKADAFTYKTEIEWRKNSRIAYQKALRKGWVSLIFPQAKNKKTV